MASHQQGDRKGSIDHVEDARSEVHNDDPDDIAPLPVSLERLSPEDLKRLGRKVTWKLDLIIMPAMTM